MAQMPEAIILRKTEETKTGVTYCMADVKTNADYIRSMSDEEFSHFLFGIQCAPASRPKEWLDWLKQEADDDKSGQDQRDDG